MVDITIPLTVFCISILVLATVVYMNMRTSRRQKRIFANDTPSSLVGWLGSVTKPFGPTTAGIVRVGEEEVIARPIDTTSSFEVGDTVKVCEMASGDSAVLVCIAHDWI